MYDRFLLIDFGATSVKTIIVDINTGDFCDQHSFPCLPNCSQIKEGFEIDVFEITKQFLSICDFYYNHLQQHFCGIVICSQMHGFILLSEDYQPLTNYISWRNNYALEKIDGKSTAQLFEEYFNENYKTLTGMRLRSTMPVVTALHLARCNLKINRQKMVTLPEWLARCSGDSNDLVHETMLAGLGVYDLNKKQVSTEILSFVKDCVNVDWSFNSIASSREVAGYWHLGQLRIPIYVGVGDHQCAVLGARNRPGTTISINVGTGSQVSVIDSKIDADILEKRPFFDGGILSTLTHIPAGRVLEVFIQFLNDVCFVGGDKKGGYWEILETIKLEEILAADLIFGLSLFPGSWKYSGGGSISNISEKNLTPRGYLAALLKDFVMQYVLVSRSFNPDNQIKEYIFSGGVARKLPVLIDAFSTHVSGEIKNAAYLDETFFGLRTLALMSKDRYLDYTEAQIFFE